MSFCCTSKVILSPLLIDEYLTFDLHTIQLCSKVMWKLSVLKKSSHLFDFKFRSTLFILSKYDYCSTLFFHFKNKLNIDRLDKNFAIFLKKYLRIDIIKLNIPDQFDCLRNHKLLPLKVRFFQNFVIFTY